MFNFLKCIALMNVLLKALYHALIPPLNVFECSSQNDGPLFTTWGFSSNGRALTASRKGPNRGALARKRKRRRKREYAEIVWILEEF